MNTTTKGDRACAAVLAALLKSNKSVCMPFGDGKRYDLVIDEQGIFQRVQVKAGRYKNGAVEFRTNSVSRNGEKKSYEGQVEFFGVWCEVLDKCYLIPIDEVGSHGSKLRVEPAKNGATVYRKAEDFEI